MSHRFTESREFGPHLDWDDLPELGRPVRSHRSVGFPWLLIILFLAAFWGGVIWLIAG